MSVDDPRLTAIGLLVEVYESITDRLAGQLAEHRLSGAEFGVLLRLARSPCGRLRMHDLAAQTMLSTSGVTRVVDRLERQDLVVRETCPGDRRGLNAVITPAGRERIEAIIPGHLELVDRWFTGLLPAAQAESFIDTLRVLRDAVRPNATAGVPAADRCDGPEPPSPPA